MNTNAMERKFLEETLSGYVAGLVKKKIIVELTGGTMIIGILLESDSLLNLKMKDTTIIRPEATEKLDELSVPGKQISYIHLENYVDVVGTIQKTCNRLKRQAIPEKTESKKFHVGGEKEEKA